MSHDQNTKLSEAMELWVSMSRHLFPGRSESYICEMRMIAAAHWLSGLDNDTAKMYDQYSMMVKLSGFTIATEK